jgi:alkanesulfonate monooxygenase SsuD/methylene tetrahydromethanopterin reductase-like flavin-dependent oxidoreductase (luciferase family)
MIYPDRPFPEFIELLQWFEELGFDQIFLPDHSADPRDTSHFWFETGSALTVAAMQTRSIRIGTLVSNPILRAPAVLAKQAIAIDHLSNGRLELGIGAGVFDWDHHAVGTEPWPPKERAGRFAEYVEIVDGILRSGGVIYKFEGAWLFAKEVATVPGPVQRPRPPLIVGGQSPTILRTAAKFADVWNTIGPMGASKQEILERTAQQIELLDELTVANGRQPDDLVRSFTPFGEWDFYGTSTSFEEVVREFSTIGMTEFIIDLPATEHMDQFEHIARRVIPELRKQI